MNNYQILSESEFNNFLRDYLGSTIVDLKLYKGITSQEDLADYYLLEPLKGIRQSKTLKDNGNTYNLLLNNLSSWDEFPKREKSIITSSSLQTANIFAQPNENRGFYFGKTFIVIPKPSSIISIAPNSDILYSFQNGLNCFKLKGQNNSLVKFNIFVAEIFRSLNIEVGFDKSWQDFQSAITEITMAETTPKSNISWEASTILNILRNNKNDVLGLLNNCFDPIRNNFVIEEYTNNLKSNEYTNREIWTESPCLLIEEKIFANFAMNNNVY